MHYWRQFRKEWTVGSNTRLRFVQLDDIHCFMVNDEVFYIDDRSKNPFQALSIEISEDPIKVKLTVNKL